MFLEPKHDQLDHLLYGLAYLLFGQSFLYSASSKLVERRASKIYVEVSQNNSSLRVGDKEVHIRKEIICWTGFKININAGRPVALYL